MYCPLIANNVDMQAMVDLPDHRHMVTPGRLWNMTGPAHASKDFRARAGDRVALQHSG